jgi:tRNA pseudouridine38-40 synthase
MRTAAAKLLGKHDFKNISIATGEKSTLCKVESIDITDQTDEIRLMITADRFLHKMVRMLVGLLVEIGRDKVSMDYLDDVLSGRKIKRKQGFAAPAHGLCLVNVAY